MREELAPPLPDAKKSRTEDTKQEKSNGSIPTGLHLEHDQATKTEKEKQQSFQEKGGFEQS